MGRISGAPVDFESKINRLIKNINGYSNAQSLRLQWTLSECVFLSKGREYILMSKMGVLFLAKASSNEYINSQINSLKVEMVRNILQMMRAEELQSEIDNVTKKEIKDRTRTNDKAIDLKKTGNQDFNKNNSSWPLIDLTRDESDEEVPGVPKELIWTSMWTLIRQ